MPNSWKKFGVFNVEGSVHTFSLSLTPSSVIHHPPSIFFLLIILPLDRLSSSLIYLSPPPISSLTDLHHPFHFEDSWHHGNIWLILNARHQASDEHGIQLCTRFSVKHELRKRIKALGSNQSLVCWHHRGCFKEHENIPLGNIGTNIGTLPWVTQDWGTVPEIWCGWGEGQWNMDFIMWDYLSNVYISLTFKYLLS